jgi:hypothetical protein
MTEPTIVHKQDDQGRAVIIATTIVLMTCIISCASVLIVLILRTS